MRLEATDLDHLTQVISHALAPSFLLGAVAGFVAITTPLVVLAFGSALAGLLHEPVAGVLFRLALGLLGAALLAFAREVWIGLDALDHHA